MEFGGCGGSRSYQRDFVQVLLSEQSFEERGKGHNICEHHSTSAYSTPPIGNTGDFPAGLAAPFPSFLFLHTECLG